ncbi:MAG TPA: hypothetical protein VMB84_20585 [Stellaceae bacterium]|nr:hypothetical protein [Stellaceae bacterium]
MRQTWAIGVLCAGLAACSVPSPFDYKVPSIPAGPGNLVADRKACNEMYPPRLGSYAAHAGCVNAAIERDAIPFARYPDLVRLQERLRLKYSADIDRRALSPREGERRMADADALVEAAMRDRDTGRNGVAQHRVDRLEALLE